MSPLYKYKAKQVIYFKLEIIALLLEVKEKINELFGEKLHANPLPEYGFTNVIFFFCAYLCSRIWKSHFGLDKPLYLIPPVRQPKPSCILSYGDFKCSSGLATA